MSDQALSQNDLYDLVADFGECLGMGLRRDSHLTRGVSDSKNWLKLSNEIGSDRAIKLSEGLCIPTRREESRMIQFQIENALSALNPDDVPSLWLCTADDDRVLLIEGWGESMDVELLFNLIGSYSSRDEVFEQMKSLYITEIDDL